MILIGFAALLFGESTLAGQRGLVLKVVIVSLAILTNITAIQRIWWVYRSTRPGFENEGTEGGEPEPVSETEGLAETPGGTVPNA